MYDYLTSGGVYIKPNFFNADDFLQMRDGLNELKYEQTYQPSGVYYGNRLQAFPCYEADYEKHKDIIINSNNAKTSVNLSVNTVDKIFINPSDSLSDILFTLYNSPNLNGKILFAI